MSGSVSTTIRAAASHRGSPGRQAGAEVRGIHGPPSATALEGVISSQDRAWRELQSEAIFHIGTKDWRGASEATAALAPLLEQVQEVQGMFESLSLSGMPLLESQTETAAAELRIQATGWCMHAKGSEGSGQVRVSRGVTGVTLYYCDGSP